MTCPEVQEMLMSYLAGDVSEKERRQVKNHVEACSACARELHELHLVWQSLDAWDEQSVPKHVEQKILRAAREASASLEEHSAVHSWGGLRRLFRPMIPLALGLVAAIFSAGVLSSGMNLSEVHPLGLTAVGALWTGIYGIVFYMLFSAGSTEARTWRAFAQASIIAVGIFLGFTLFSPVPSSVHFCRYYSLTQPVVDRLSIGGTFFLFGALYALIPMSLAAYLSGARAGKHPWAKGSLAGVMFVALIAPGIYLQCAPFAFGVLLVWFGGALVGSVLGGVLGYWVRYRFAS
ncbi:MAG: hypothetical protein D6743_04485 [Calditrichaeota bacterium]|nr:MAG: hypothetical protein D6743_04485 [Calditrichota bacterium]